MNKKTLTFNYSEGSDISDLPEEKQVLINKTVVFAQNAYAPYSNFFVSAGLILDNSEMHFGTNVENASYPVGVCAERTLLSHTISNYPSNKIQTLSVYVDKEVDKPVPPCGLCRQSLLEAELRQKSNIEIILFSKDGTYNIFEKAADLLPLYFDGKVL
jgi:cytidine deaminase